MEMKQDERIFLIPNRTIRWSFAGFVIILLGVIFYFIHRYLYGTVQDGLAGAYLTFVLALFIIWFLGIIFFLIYLVLKYDPMKNPDSPYVYETLSLPPGVFRAILTVTLLFAIVLLEGYALTSIDKHEPIQKILNPLITAFELMIAFYFGTKMVSMVSGNGKDESQPKG
jgi:hypothetical protein